ncbi:hypothetical protein HDU81_004350 [Chytriomyces hyalinus]|nr:hypothetical protein HDU81_004350 [Chytriomyces hyalinus]
MSDIGESDEEQSISMSMTMSYEYAEDDDDQFDDDHANGNGDEESLFEPVVTERHTRKGHEIPHAVLSVADITQRQAAAVDHVSGIIGCLPSTAATLLRHFKWNKDRLIDRFYADGDSRAVCASAGVIVDAGKQPRLMQVRPFECPVCYDDDPESTLALECGHRHCQPCYSRYLTIKIAEEGESRRIQCLDAACSLIVDEKTVQLLVEPAVFEKYQTLLLRTYVDDNKFLKWCPYPNCEYAVECRVLQSQLDEIVPSVACGDGHRFCFGCSLSDHQPCPCSLVKLWLKKCADDSETANWISANTKECEKCQSTIEKNGGCNHMTCRKCKYEFCWVCMGPWTDHGTQWYNCNRFDEKAGIDARDNQAKSRALLERYLHYFNRYANHELSAKLDKDLSEKIELKMQEMQKTSDMSWIQVQFMKSAKETLLEARNTLKWTYSFAYYLTRSNTTLLFEDNQRDLEMAVEQLSGLLESQFEPAKLSELKQQVIDKSVYVAGRRDVLLSATSKDLADGKMTWNVDDIGNTFSLQSGDVKK